MCMHLCTLWWRKYSLKTHTCSHCLQLEWISLPPRCLKSCVLSSSEGGERRQQGQTGVTQAFLRERPFLVAAGLLACRRRDHRNRFLFFQVWDGDKSALGIRLRVYPEVRDETLPSLLLRIRAKFLLLLEEEEEYILCHIWTFTRTFFKKYCRFIFVVYMFF